MGRRILWPSKKAACSFYAARYRCANKKCSMFKHYGGRGIKFKLELPHVAFLWYRDRAYEMKRPGIDRIDRDGDYIMSNCRFVEMSENIGRSNTSEKGRKGAYAAHRKLNHKLPFNLLGG